MSEVVKVDYDAADDEIKNMEKAVEDLDINVETIEKNTNGISSDTWVGKDADAYQTKILEYSKDLKNQTDNFKKLIEEVRNYIQKIKEEEAANASEEMYSSRK
jgi:hypothetical protein